MPLAMICLVALSLMVLTLLSLSSVEPQIAQNLADTARARYLAESGIEWAFKQVAASPVGDNGVFAASLFAGPDQVQDTTDDGQPTGVPGQNTAAMLTALGSPSRLPSRPAADGVYAVTVRNDHLAGDDRLTGVAVDSGDKSTDRNGIVIVTSTGMYRSATRTIQVVIKRVGLPPFPGAVNVAGERAEVFLGSAGSSSADRVDIDGRDYDRSGAQNGANAARLGIQTMLGVQADVDMSYEARVEAPFDDASICPGGDCSAGTTAAHRDARLGIVKGRDQSSNYATSGLGAIGPDATLNPAVMRSFLSQIAANAATRVLSSTPACPLAMAGGVGTATRTPTVTNGCGLSQTLDLGATSDPKIVHVRGDSSATTPLTALTLNGGIQGAGILIVENGDLEQRGSLRWDGVVIVTGPHVSAAFRTGSATTVYGALTSMETLPGAAGGAYSVFIDDELDFRVRASRQNLDMAQQMLALHTILTWRER
jgi:hypothetical protein